MFRTKIQHIACLKLKRKDVILVKLYAYFINRNNIVLRDNQSSLTLLFVYLYTSPSALSY